MNRRDAIRLLGGTPLAMAAAGTGPDEVPARLYDAALRVFPSGTRTLRNSIRGIRIRRVGYDAPKQSRT